MQKPLSTFWLKAMVGYGIVVLLLAGGMIFTACRFDGVAAAHVARLRAQEDQITFAERLRWSGEAIVSTGRGYLISADGQFLTRLQDAQATFDRGIEVLTRGSVDATTRELLAEVERRAGALRADQDRLVTSMKHDDLRTVARRFEDELVPLQVELGTALDRLIDYKERRIDDVYARVATERARLRTSLYVLLAILVVASTAIAAYIATVLGRSYRQEHDALATAQDAITSRDQIMAVVAHDLRNPLSSIAMRATLLRSDETSAAARKHGAAIESVTSRMAGLIKTMLDAATIESGALTVTPEPCALGELLDASTEMLSGAAAQKQLVLEQAPAARSVWVLADRERVLQVLQNLIGNAIKFTAAGGRIVLAVEARAGQATVRVSDSGPGIPPAHLGRIFDRFWKHETGGKKGTGLGLFISRGIVTAHGGRIWAENRAGGGASLAFTLPTTPAPASPVADVSPAPIDPELRRRALERWENEGGRAAPGPASPAPSSTEPT
jgi:signal transduction histidine kinase